MARWIAMAAIAAATAAQAAEEADLSTRSRALAAKSMQAPGEVAPFVSRPDPLALLSFSAQPMAIPRGVACGGTRVVCYEPRERGLVYRGARDFMPRPEGLTPEGVSVRHDRLVLRYSFR